MGYCWTGITCVIHLFFSSQLICFVCISLGTFSFNHTKVSFIQSWIFWPHLQKRKQVLCLKINHLLSFVYLQLLSLSPRINSSLRYQLSTYIRLFTWLVAWDPGICEFKGFENSSWQQNWSRWPWNTDGGNYC